MHRKSGSELLSHTTFHAAFLAGIIVKILDGATEATLGILLFFLGQQTIDKILFFFAGVGTTEPQVDFLRRALFHDFTGITTDAQHFWTFFLIAHGLTNLFLVIGLLKKKAWAYPVAGIVFAFFALYQTYRLTYDSSALLLILTIFDILFVALIFYEYAHSRKGIANGQ